MYAEPAREYVERRGGSVRTGTPAKVHIDRGRVTAVEASGERWTSGAVVSAVPWFAVSDLFDGDLSALAETLTRARGMMSSPIVTVNLWFDRQVMNEPFLGLPGRTMQWLFDKKTAFGDAASHLSLVSSGAAPIVHMLNPELIAAAQEELLEALPAVRSAKLLRATVVREPRATFSLAPGQPARPSTGTPVQGLYLAGDWIDTGLPATIESAVRSGHRAAAAVMAR
jgi:protoporphyrinogen oxidase